MTIKFRSPVIRFPLFISLFAVYAITCIQDSWGQIRESGSRLVEKELIQYTLSPAFERVIQQFIREGENTFYKDKSILMTVSFFSTGCDIEGYIDERRIEAGILTDAILGYFTVSGHDFIIYAFAGPKHIENICFKGSRKRKFKMWDDTDTIIFEEPSVFYRIMNGKDGQFRLIKEYYDPDTR